MRKALLHILSLTAIVLFFACNRPAPVPEKDPAEEQPAEEDKPDPEPKEEVEDPSASLLLDIEFADDGSARDISSHSRLVNSFSGLGVCTYFNQDAGRNVARFFSSAGSQISDGYYKVTYNNDSRLAEGLGDGHSYEAMFMLSGVKPSGLEVKPMSATEAGGSGILLNNPEGMISFIANTAAAGGAGQWRYAISGIVPKAGDYYHVVGVYDKDAEMVSVYINGELKGHTAAPGKLVLPVSAIAKWICIGGDACKSISQAEAAWSGDIVLARVYDKPLTADQVALLWDKAPKNLKAPAADIADLLMLSTAVVRPSGKLRILGRGFQDGDQIRLTHTDGTSATDCPAQVLQDGLELTLPADIASGTYKVFVVRNGANNVIGLTTLILADDTTPPMARPRVIAHRGYHKNAPENSLAALAAAQELGCYGVEMDVWISLDGKVFVNHDGMISGKSIQNSSSEDLAGITLSNGEALSTLEEFLAQAKKNTAVRTVVEVKQHNSAEKNARCTAEMLRIVRQMGMEQYCDFISFDEAICRQIAAELPGAKVGCLTTTDNLEGLVSGGINCIDFSYADLIAHPEYISKAHSLGMEVNIWTVNAATDMARAIALGVDYITTDNPDQLMQLSGLIPVE